MSDRSDVFYASDGIHGYGAQLMCGDGESPENFEAVAFVKTITPGDMTTESIDQTHLRSPAAHREKRAGLRDSGPFAVQLLWAPNEQSQSNAGGGSGPFQNGGLVAMWIDRQTRNWKIVLNDGSPATEWPFRGFVSKFQIGEIGEDSVIMADAEITPASDFSADLP